MGLTVLHSLRALPVMTCHPAWLRMGMMDVLCAPPPTSSSPGFADCGSPAYSRSSMDGRDANNARRSSNMSAPMLWRSSIGRLMSAAAGGSLGQHPLPLQPYVTKQEVGACMHMNDEQQQ